MADTPTFEVLRDTLLALSVPDGEARQLVWVVTDRLGAAMTTAGAYEIFLLGPNLRAASPLVAGNLQHDRWEPSAGGPPFEASRVLLGAAVHFAAVAALIATELSRYDLSTEESVQAAFSEVEPIIELAIRRSALSNEAILGLFAELHVLRVVLLGTTSGDRPAALLGWRGWAPGRDFIFGEHGIEVKATLGASSRHWFSGIHQLEAQAEGAEGVHLLSVGLQEVAAGGASLPELVEDILSLLSGEGVARTSAQQQLLTMIANYGGPSAPSYEHDSMRGWSVYSRRFAISFVRLYDVADPALKLLSREQLEETYINPDSLSFELVLPDRVSLFNPADNWQSDVADIVRG